MTWKFQIRSLIFVRLALKIHLAIEEEFTEDSAMRKLIPIMDVTKDIEAGKVFMILEISST